MHMSCHTYEWVMSHIWRSRFTNMNESCRTYEWVMSHIWMSRVAHMNESCHTWMRRVTHMNESCPTSTLPVNVDSSTESWYTYEWGLHATRQHSWRHRAMSPVYLPNLTFTGSVDSSTESCYTYEWGMPHLWTSHVTHMNELCHTNEWGMHATRHLSSRHRVMSPVCLNQKKNCKFFWSIDSNTESCHPNVWTIFRDSKLDAETIEYLFLESHLGRLWYVNGSCHTHEWGNPHLSLSHVTHMNEACHTSTLAATRSHVTCMCEYFFKIQNCIHEQYKTPVLKVTLVDSDKWMGDVCVFLQKSPTFYKRALLSTKEPYFLQ